MSEKHITFAAKNKKHETIINHSYPDAGRAWREGGNAVSRQGQDILWQSQSILTPMWHEK